MLLVFVESALLCLFLLLCLTLAEKESSSSLSSSSGDKSAKLGGSGKRESRSVGSPRVWELVEGALSFHPSLLPRPGGWRLSSFLLFRFLPSFFFFACTPPVSSYLASYHSFDLSFQPSSLPCPFPGDRASLSLRFFSSGQSRSLEGFGG